MRLGTRSIFQYNIRNLTILLIQKNNQMIILNMVQKSIDFEIIYENKAEKISSPNSEILSENHEDLEPMP